MRSAARKGGAIIGTPLAEHVRRADISRRDFLKLTGMGLAGAALLPASTGATQPTEIVFSSGPDESGTVQDLIDTFNEEHLGQVRVTWRKMARESDAHFLELQSAFLAEAADIDVIAADVVWTAAYATRGWVRDLSSRFFNTYDPDDFLRTALQSAAYRFKIWGVPWRTDAGMLFYRKDLLAQSGFTTLPNTWDELKRIAKRVMEDARTRYGFVFQGAAYEGGVANALEYIWSAGGRVMTGNITVAGEFGQSVFNPNVITVNSKASARGLDIARSMIAEGITPPEVATFRELESGKAFLSGEAVFMRNWPHAYGFLKDPKWSRITPKEVGVAPLPAASPTGRRYSCLGGWNLMINARSDRRKREAAWTFIRYMTAAAQQKRMALTGGFLPTLRGLYDDREIINSVPVIALAKEVITHIRLRPVSPFYMQMQPRIARAFNRTLKGHVTGSEAVRTLQHELQNIMRRNR
ncbi:MAG: ABC transporter substrate-binding protein [Candidatus Methylomirabilales bacterium]